MNKRNTTGIVLAVAGLIASNAGATTITYVATPISGNQWQYDYVLTNDTLGSPIDEFTIYFDLGVFDALSAVDAPSGWDSAIVQPGSFLGINDGYYDALALSATPLASGESAGIFSVQFNFLGTGAPGAQFYEVVNPVDYSVLDSGYTMPAAIVPLPAGAWLFGAGLLGLAGIARRNTPSSAENGN